MKYTVILTMIGAVLLAAAASCDNAKKSGAGTENVVVEQRGDTIAVQSRDGSLAIEGNEQKARIKIKTREGEDIDLSYQKDALADNFPADVPVFTPSTVAMSQVFTKGAGAVATLTTDAAPGDIASFYQKAMKENGWSIGEKLTLGNMTILNGEKSTATLNISILTEKGDTKINMARTAKGSS